jgi:hypothetical protein
MAVPAVPSTSPKTNAAAGAMASKGQLEPDEDTVSRRARAPVDARYHYAQTARDRCRSRACALCPGKRSWRSHGSSVMPRLDLRAGECR